MVEGFDASGKSTLGVALAARYELPLCEAGPPPKDMLHAIRDSLNQFYIGDAVHVRITPISNKCYQYREVGGQYDRYLNQVLRMYQDEGTIFVFCTGKADNHDVKDYDTEEHIQHITENEKHIRWKYEGIINLIRDNRVLYDFTKDSLEDLFCHIDKLIATRS